MLKLMSDKPSAEFLALQEAVAGRYSLEHELGRGGMGIVYLAHEVSLDRPVALKLLPPELAAQPTLRERFLREARTAAKLSHPNIVPIFAVAEVADFVFFAMAYVDGETLGHRIRSRGPLPPTEATRILREVAWALAYAHAQGVVHRDVKPDNILLEEDSGRALVTDFGIAHVREQPGVTGVGEVLGTAEFMSPEQASGEAIDPRSDIYSLGVLGYYTLSGKLPFEGPTVSSVLAKHITQPAPPLSSVAPEAPPKLARVIDRCLGKEPGQRFAHGAELAEALGEALEVRRELPVALRVFIKLQREFSRSSQALVVILLMLAPGAIALALEGETVMIAVLGSLLAAFAVTPVGILAHRARKLLKSGYGRDELLVGLRTDLDRRREEVAFEYGRKPTIIERTARLVAIASLATFGIGAISFAVLWGPSPAWMGGVLLMGVSATTGVGAGLIAATRYERRRDLSGERWLKFWKSRFGRWIFKLARLRLKRVISTGAVTYRRTELALGMAADRLYEELPKAVRKSLRDLPDVVRKLEADAQKMRHRVDELNGTLAELGDDEYGSRVLAATPSSGVSDQREALASDLRGVRDAAQQRLADAVASLETIRLDLLRMQAGAGSVEGITADLASALEVADGIDALLAGEAEVEALLKEG